jgi:hypothetical protein
VQQAALAAQEETSATAKQMPHASPQAATAAASGASTVRKLALSVAMLSFAALVTWFTWSEISGLFASPPPPPPPLAMTGSWSLAEQPGSGGPWTIVLNHETCTITGPDGTPFSSPVTITQETPHFAGVSLSKPHPRFGQMLNFLATNDGAIVMAGGIEAKAHISP